MPESQELKQELTTRDLKAMFGVSRSTIYNWRKKGLQFFKIKGNGLSDPVRYHLNDVEAFAKDTDKAIINPIYVPK